MPKGKVIDRDEVKALAEEGKGTTEIAKIIGCDRRTVSRIRNELGIPVEEGSTVEKWIDKDVKVKAWLAKLKERHGRLQYAGALRRYCDIRDKAPDELLEEAWEDTQQRKPHERKLPDIMLIYKSKREEEGKSPNTIAYELSAIRSFYKRNGYDIIERKELIERPRPRDENGKEVIYPDKMRELASIMIPMDKAMYLSAYQSGLSQKELLGLKMRDIKRIEDGIIRLPERTRAKTGIRFRSFIGNDAREAIDAWLQKRNSGNLLPKNREASMDAVVKSEDDYLFVGYDKRHGRWGRVSPTTFDKRMRDYCRQLGWLKIEDGEFKKNGLQSRYRPHALRMSFSTILKSKNVAALHVEHMLGHAAAYNGAYDVVNEVELFETYKRAEKYLSIRPEPSKELETIEELRMELEAMKVREAEKEEKIKGLKTDVDISGELIAKMVKKEMEKYLEEKELE